MCVRKIFRCPDCNSFQTIPNSFLNSTETGLKVVLYESPCGFSFCDCFDQIFPNIPRPFNSDEINRPCSQQCDFRKCRIEPVLRSCCRPSRTNLHYCLVTVAMLKHVDNVIRNVALSQYRLALANATPDPSSQEDLNLAVVDTDPTQTTLQILSGIEMGALLANHCSMVDCRNLYVGGTVCTSLQDMHFMRSPRLHQSHRRRPKRF